VEGFQVSGFQVSVSKPKSKFKNHKSKIKNQINKMLPFSYRHSPFRPFTFYQQNQQIEKFNQ